MFRIRIYFLRIRIQRLRMETNTDPDTDPDPIRIQGFNDQKFKKYYSWKKIKFFFDQTAIYLSLGFHKVCPGYRRSLQLTKEAVQHFKSWIFSPFVGHFCPPGSGFRIRIRIHWPRLNKDPIRIRIWNPAWRLGRLAPPSRPPPPKKKEDEKDKDIVLLSENLRAHLQLSV